MAGARLKKVREDRLKKLEALRARRVNPYPPSYERTHTTRDASKLTGRDVRVAGRIRALRGHGGSLFADLADLSGKIQVFFQKDILGDEKYSLIELLDLGDFLGVAGEVFKTQKGEVTVRVSDFEIVSKALRPFPAKIGGIKDIEERYRQRYLDLQLNEGVRERFIVRSQIIREVRRYLDSLDFLEVETPVLQPLYGGTNAAPFKTKIRALDTEMYLRIAPELYLKRLIVGGFEKVYEIARNFRNEGIDRTHNPEFTMIEYYEAYADYQRMMDTAESLFKHIAKQIFDKTEVEVGNQMIDIGKPWRRITMVEAIKEHLGLDVEGMEKEALVKFAKKHDLKSASRESKGQVIFDIFDHLVTGKLIEPTWIIDYPQEVSPLAKPHREKVGWVERFEGYIGGREIVDGWSEITDPVEQRRRFEEDQKAEHREGENAHPVDDDFLRAMEYGMPPLGGIGIGIDRLVMFFTNTWIIKEVILFPTLKPTR